MAVDISSIQLQIEEELYKDVQYLSQFFSWHNKASKENRHFKFRPPYNVSVHGNSHQYWQYAINSIVYYKRKEKKEKQLKHKRHREMLELSELYTLEMINDYYERSGYQQKQLSSSYQIQEDKAVHIEFESQQRLRERIKYLETKLSPEQTVVARKRAEKQGKGKIEEIISNTGWRYWIPGKVKNFISGSS